MRSPLPKKPQSRPHIKTDLLSHFLKKRIPSQVRTQKLAHKTYHTIMAPFTPTTIVNPYYRTEEQRQIIRNAQVVAQQQTNMGIQSQKRDGAVRKCMKRGTKLKAKHKVVSHHQQAILNGAVAFDPIEHCDICKAQYQNDVLEIPTRVPKRAHHKACVHNRATRGHSEMTVFFNKEAAKNLAARNGISMKQRQSIKKKKAPTTGFFVRRTTNRKMNNVGPSIGPTFAASTTATNYNSKKLANPASLRLELDFRMEKLEKGDDYQWVLQNKKYPAAVGLMADYIMSLFEHRKPSTTTAPLPNTVVTQDAILKYRQFFSPGSLSFTFPMDVNDHNHAPSPNYHLLEGESILHVDWKLAFPSVDLLCYNCKHGSSEKADRHLVHDRTNFSKKKSLFPIWSHSGLPTWCILMNYKCEHCKTCYAANDGRLLSLLPSDISSTYPVLPKYASGLFHLHKDLSDDLDILMRTYANGKFVSGKLYRKLGVIYTRKVQTYLARSPTRPFISYEAFSGGISPPTAAAIRQCFDDSEHSPLTAYGFSNFERYEREMQSVVVDSDEKIAIDWTFQPLKNYILPGAKAIFTVNKGSTKEMVNLAIVANTGASQVSHLLLQMREHRLQCDPAALYSDICPHNDPFWELIFGPKLETKLGLFHLLHRIYDTLDNRSDIYWKCLLKLKNAVYSYNEKDEAALLTALKNGRFSKTNEKLSDTQIRELRHSKRWKERYSAFLRKRILPGTTIQHRLYLWIQEYKDATDQKGKSIFTRNTEKVATEQLKKVEHVTDVENTEMYQEIPPGPRSTHGLSKWKCDRPESPLEKFHELMAHFGNTGMSKQLADTLTLGGTAEYNVKQRWKARVNKMRLAGIIVNIPGSFVDLPQFYDHSFLQYLNAAAENCGLSPVFGDVHQIRENNGEVFLSKYFEEQTVRNNTVKQDPKTKVCLCLTCKATTASQLVTAAGSPAIHNINDMDISNAVITDRTSLLLPVVVQQPAQQTTNNRFVQQQPRFRPPVPLALLTRQSLLRPRPVDCCFIVGNYYCSTYELYLAMKFQGIQVLGKPPHHLNCPHRLGRACHR